LSRFVGLILMTALMQSCGCAAYRFGHQTMYRPDIRTVHVPVFRSESLRRNLSERVTEAVIKEIEQRTPYKVVAGANADSVLMGQITHESKRVIANNRYNDARDIETELTVEVVWTNRHGELLMQSGSLPLPQMEVEVLAQSQFLPEAGQSLATAQQAAIERLARDIVNQMEIWW
jgi:hypothetical protein